MLNPQYVSADDVQQDLLQRTQRWLDILEARTLALLAATDPETLTPAKREQAINRYLQLTTRFLKLRQLSSGFSKAKPDYNPWLDQILGDPPPSDSPPFAPNNQPPSEEDRGDAEVAHASPLETLEPQAETTGQASPDSSSPPFDLNRQSAFLPGNPEACDTLSSRQALEAEARRSEAWASASQLGASTTNANDPVAWASQVLDRWPSAIIRPEPELDWLSSDF